MKPDRGADSYLKVSGYSLLLLYATLVLSLPFFTGCNDNPTDDSGSDTVYVYLTDTLFMTDTFHVADTFSTIDTLWLLDTVLTTDTVFTGDTFYVTDTVAIDGHAVYHIPWAGWINPHLEGDNTLRSVFLLADPTDEAILSVLPTETDVCVSETAFGFIVVSSGRTNTGGCLDAGEYVVGITLDTEHGSISVAETLRVMDFAITGVTFDNSQDYIYHKSRPDTREYIEIGASEPKWKRENGAQPKPEPWWQNQYPPFHYRDTLAYNLPVILKRDTDPTVILDMEGLDVLVSVNGGAFLPSGETRLLRDLNDRIGSGIRTLHYRFAVEDGSDLVGIPGEFTTDHIVYTIFDEPVLLDATSWGGSPALPWLQAVALCSEWCSGDETEDEAVYHIRQAIIYDLGFYYSGRNYTHYDGSYTDWDRIHLEFADFLDMSLGDRLYCHDVACAFSAFAGNFGIDLPYVYLGIGFSTNYIRGIGHDSWTTFSWTAHSVNSLNGGETVYDACLNLDGDDDPSSAPHEDLDVADMPLAEYLDRLSAGTPPTIQHIGYPLIH